MPKLRSKMRLRRTAATAIALASWSATAAATSVEEVVAKHISARGGDAWARINTIKATGSFTAFSKQAPFTLHKKRGAMYLLTHELNEHPVVIGSDGAKPWMDNAFTEPGAKPLQGADLAALTRDFDFITPFFDIEASGHTVKLIGETEYEGEPAIGIELTRQDGSSETWYLDPETHLEMARRSPGSDFGRPMEQRTVFDDFRRVNGVMIPHFIETQWYTRDRVMQIDELTVNVDIDDAMFRMPAPPGMGPLQSLAGEWDVKVEQRNRPGGEFRESTRTSTIEDRLRGGMFEERFASDGNDTIRWWTYDRFRETYRMVEIDSRMMFIDVQEGPMGDDGKLTVHNFETGTTTHMMGMNIHARSSLADITEDGFLLEQEVSIDGGKSWWVAARSTYTRQAKKTEQAKK